MVCEVQLVYGKHHEYFTAGAGAARVMALLHFDYLAHSPPRAT
jgi:hypothetical protein